MSRNPVQQVPDHRSRHYRRGLVDKDQEGGLEGVFSVVAGEETSAHAPHHRAVTPNKGGEGCFVVTLEESAEEFVVAMSHAVTQDGTAEIVQQFAYLPLLG
ncbi:MAG: hypothetical protein U0792_00705 [Gemmataceae bacterium]